MLQWVGKEVIRMLSQDELHRLLLRLSADVKDVDTELIFDKGRNCYTLQDIRRYDLTATRARVEEYKRAVKFGADNIICYTEQLFEGCTQCPARQFCNNLYGYLK